MQCLCLTFSLPHCQNVVWILWHLCNKEDFTYSFFLPLPTERAQHSPLQQPPPARSLPNPQQTRRLSSAQRRGSLRPISGGAQRHPRLWPTAHPVPPLLTQPQGSNVLFPLTVWPKQESCRLLHTENPGSLHRLSFRHRILNLHGDLRCLAAVLQLCRS